MRGPAGRRGPARTGPDRPGPAARGHSIAAAEAMTSFLGMSGAAAPTGAAAGPGQAGRTIRWIAASPAP